MSVPKGLRKPIYVAELIPPGLVLIGVGVAVFFAFLHLSEMGWPSL